MKEYSKGIYVKFKPEEVEILHNRMKEAGVQNMSAYIRKMALNGYVIIPEWPDWGARRPVDVCSARTGVERRSSPTSKNAPGIYRSTACQFVKSEKKGSSL